MIQRIVRVLRRTGLFYLEKQIPRSSAAMSYYLTMSLFPLIICLYALLGKSYQQMSRVLELADHVLQPTTTQFLKSFLIYVATNPSRTMVVAAILLLLSSASAAVRVLHLGLQEIHGRSGGKRAGLRNLLSSFVFSIAFVAAMYFGILVMMTGKSFLQLLERLVPVLHISRAWNWMRFLVLGGLVFLTLWGVYVVSGLRLHQNRPTAPGAFAGTLGIVLMSGIFSAFIAVSTRYPLVYGSLASIILLMFWLFLCCQIIYTGEALNEAIFRERQMRENKEPGEKQPAKE